jgi:hypothetical protein
MKHKQFKLSILIFLALEMIGLKAQDCRNMMLTSETYSETINMQNAIRHEFGDKSSIADWSDLQAIRNIDAWISCMGLQKGETFFLTKNNNFTFRENRHYFVLYSPNGKLPLGFLAHDQIDNKLFLGSWYGVKRNILAIRNNTYIDDNKRNKSHHYVDLKITYKQYNETENLNEAIRYEFHGRCFIADWIDLKSLSNIDAWIAFMNLQRNQTFFLTRNGNFTFNGNRHYFVLYSPNGQLPFGFLAHDQIDNKLFLYSWYGIKRQVLIKEYPQR